MKKQDIIKHIQLEMLDGGKDIEEIKNLTKDYHRLTLEALLDISDTHTQRYNRKFDDSTHTRTQKIIDQFKADGKDNEWACLKGILLITCCDWRISDNIRFRNNVIDTGMIAGRMDEISKEQMAQYEVDKKANEDRRAADGCCAKCAQYNDNGRAMCDSCQTKETYGEDTTHCVVSIQDKDIPVTCYKVIPITESLLNNDQECWNREVWGTEQACNETCKDLIRLAELDGRDIWYDVVNDYTLIECKEQTRPADANPNFCTSYPHHKDFYNEHNELIYAQVTKSHPLYGIITSNETNHSYL